MTTIDLNAATQSGGDPDGWPWDPWDLLLWSIFGAGEVGFEDLITMRDEVFGGDPGATLESIAPELSKQPKTVIIATAWAGMARYAIEQRDASIGAIPLDVSTRKIGEYVGLSHVQIGTIRRRRNAT